MNDPIDFIHNLSFNHLPPYIVDAAIRALTDTLGVGIAGSTTKLSSIIRNHASSHFGARSSENSATLWTDGRSLSPIGAALANGMTIDSLDGHDGQKLTKGHVGCGTIPAVFAMAEATGNLDPAELIAAVVVGYEVGSRAGIALHSTACDYHTSGAWVALAAAAIGARYLKLDHQQTREALGIAEYHGPRSQMMRTIDHPTMVKDGSGWGSMAGVSAAYLAKDGFTGAPAITVEDQEVSSLWSDLGQQWFITDQYIKLYPVCRWAQPPIEAVLTLKRQYGFDPCEIKQVHISTFHEAKRLATRHPKTTEQAQYSLPFPVAAALVYGTVSAEHISNVSLSDPTILALCDKIKITENDTFNEAFPKNRIAKAAVELTDGRVLESEPMEAIGDPENPVDQTTIEKKHRQLSSPVIGLQETNQLLDLINGLPDASSIGPILEMLTQPPRTHL